jgi:transcription antitermination factor NusA-like protein
MEVTEIMNDEERIIKVESLPGDAVKMTVKIKNTTIVVVGENS